MRQFEYFRRLFLIAQGGRRLDADIIIQGLLRARQNIINHWFQFEWAENIMIIHISRNTMQSPLSFRNFGSSTLQNHRCFHQTARIIWQGDRLISSIGTLFLWFRWFFASLSLLCRSKCLRLAATGIILWVIPSEAALFMEKSYREWPKFLCICLWGIYERWSCTMSLRLPLSLCFIR